MVGVEMKFPVPFATFAALTSISLAGCSQRPTQPLPTTLAEAMDDCSPFSDFQGTMTLSFSSLHKLTQTIAEPNEKVGAKAPSFEKKWEERPGKVIAFPVYNDGGEGWSDYQLIRSSTGELCILTQGDGQTINIHEAFFGSYAPEDEPDRPDPE